MTTPTLPPRSAATRLHVHFWRRTGVWRDRYVDGRYIPDAVDVQRRCRCGATKWKPFVIPDLMGYM